MENKNVSWLQYGLTAILIIASWFVTNCLNQENLRQQKFRDIRLNYLIDSYSKLTNFSHRPPDPKASYEQDFESAIATIQLFGTKKQIEEVYRIYDEYPKTHIINLDPLINDLRSDLRKELGSDTVSSSVMWVRLNPKSDTPSLSERSQKIKPTK